MCVHAGGAKLFLSVHHCKAVTREVGRSVTGPYRCLLVLPSYIVFVRGRQSSDRQNNEFVTGHFKQSGRRVCVCVCDRWSSLCVYCMCNTTARGPTEFTNLDPFLDLKSKHGIHLKTSERLKTVSYMYQT